MWGGGGKEEEEEEERGGGYVREEKERKLKYGEGRGKWENRRRVEERGL